MTSWSALPPKDRKFCLTCWKHMSAEGLPARPLQQIAHVRAQNRKYDSIPDLNFEAGTPTSCFGLSREARLCTVGFGNRTLFAHSPLMALFAAALLNEPARIIVHDDHGIAESCVIACKQRIQFRPVELEMYIDWHKHPSDPRASTLDVDETWKRRWHSPFFLRPSLSANDVYRSLQSLRKMTSDQSRHL